MIVKKCVEMDLEKLSELNEKCSCQKKERKSKIVSQINLLSVLYE